MLGRSRSWETPTRTPATPRRAPQPRLDPKSPESTIGQIKAELVHRRGPWRTVEALEFALFEYLDWWNHRRLHAAIGMIPPVEKETAYRLSHRQPAGDPRSVTTS